VYQDRRATCVSHVLQSMWQLKHTALCSSVPARVAAVALVLLPGGTCRAPDHGSRSETVHCAHT
jgi:hypothetical protein